METRAEERVRPLCQENPGPLLAALCAGKPSRYPAPRGLVLPQPCEGIPVELPLLQVGKLRDGDVPWGRPGPDSGRPGASGPAPWAPPETPVGSEPRESGQPG